MNRRGCWVAVFAFLGLLVLAIAFIATLIRDGKQHAQQQREMAIAQFKAGPAHDIDIYDVTLLERLADDPECIAKVEEIRISNADLSQPGWDRLKEFDHLKSLAIEYSDADKLFERLQGIPRLEDLRLACGVSDAGMRFIARCSKLKSLYLACGGRRSPLPLKEHASIETLGLDNFNLSDDWLVVLKSLPRLQTLNVEGGGEASNPEDYVKACEALEKQLQRELPNCKVGPLK